MDDITQKKDMARQLINTMTEDIKSKKFDTDGEVFAYHRLMSFLFSLITSKSKVQEEQQEFIKLNILNEVIKRKIFHSYQAVLKIIEEPKENLNKMIPFIFCFQEYLELKELANCCDEEKINYLKEALLLPKDDTPSHLISNIFCKPVKMRYNNREIN